MNYQFDLSIILPAYNVENYIEKAIQSILKLAGLRYEIIVVDDGSTDKTAQVIKQKFEMIENLKLIHQANQGSGMARNNGLKIAQGNYVLFMDPDDQLLAQTFGNNFQRMTTQSPDLVIFGMQIYREIDQKIEACFFDLSEKFYSTNAELQKDLYHHHQQMTYTPPWNKLIRRDFLEKTGLRFPNQRTGQDVVFAIDLFNRVQTAYWTPEVCYRYTLGRKNSASNKRNPRMVEDNVIIAKKLLEQEQDLIHQKIFSDLVVSFGMRELRHCQVSKKSFSAFRHYLKESSLNPYLREVAFKWLSGERKLQYLTRKTPFLAYLYFRYKL